MTCSFIHCYSNLHTLCESKFCILFYFAKICLRILYSDIDINLKFYNDMHIL